MLGAQLSELSTLCERLKVFKRTASNVKGQLTILNDVGLADYVDRQLQTILEAFCEGLREACTPHRPEKDPLNVLHSIIGGWLDSKSRRVHLTDLDWFLSQGSVSTAIESAYMSIWDVVQVSLDGETRDRVTSQRDLYAVDRTADEIELKYLLRSCLRDEHTLTYLQTKRPSEIKTLLGAVNLELSKSTSSGNDIYGTWLARWQEVSKDKNGLSVVKEVWDLTGKVTLVGPRPVGVGGFTEIWKGKVYGTTVAAHKPRGITQSASAVLKNALEWAQFDHPNVLPLTGACRHFTRKGDVALLSPWMDNGPIMSYLHDNPTANRLKLITDVVAGLEYLHTRNPPFAHSNLTRDNIFVNDQGAGTIGGLAWKSFWTGDQNQDNRSFLAIYPYLPTGTQTDAVHGIHATLQADIFSLSMIIYQILTDHLPFEGQRTAQIVVKLSQGIRPERPQGLAKHRGLGDDVWNLIQRCWAADEHARPSASELLNELKRIQSLPSLNVTDLTDELVFSSDWNLVVARGGFGEVRKAQLKDGKAVALKSISYRSALRNQPILRQTKRFRREVTIWNQLRHPNVLPFLGIAEINGLSTALVSPWMEKGNCIEYLKAHPDVSRLPIILGIIKGLAHLHGHNPLIVHGDLRGANVLMSSSGEPLLTDFGLAVIIEDLSNMPISSALDGSGNPRWMAPELLVGSDIVSTESDIWAFGMVVLEITTLDIPFVELKTYPQVILALHNQNRPQRPNVAAVTHGLSDALWALCEKCWSQLPQARPGSLVVLEEIESLCYSF